ncbi:MAG: hypothetical protein MJK12_12380 [Colwellia sp.]|nr:hypothetical protein [Colwellia sp.]
MVKTKLLVVMLLMLSGCSAIKNYEFGDISTFYCNSTSEEYRADIRALWDAKGFKIGFNYCTAHGLVDAMGGDN